jgi:hypothetical protein
LSSLLWWTRRVIAMRKNFRAFSRGSLEFLFPDNSKVLAFLRRHENETILVVANLSRFSQAAEIDLSRFAGCAPMEVFSRNIFPTIRKARYLLTIGPHGHFWFILQAQSGKRPLKKRVVPSLEAEANLQSILPTAAHPTGAFHFARVLEYLSLVRREGENDSRDTDHRTDSGRGKRRAVLAFAGWLH